MTKTNDYMKQAAEQIIALMQKHGADWCKPWSGIGAPHNVVTKKAYRGGNAFWLALCAANNDYTSGEWATFKQWKEKGATVKKGEKSTPIFFFSVFEREDKATGEKIVSRFWKHYNVFNAAQVDGYEAKPVNGETFQPIEAAQAYFANTGAQLRDGGNRAFYHPASDYIAMPPMQAFDNATGYYSTLLHELTHWTGHASRCDRKLTGKFGSEDYAREELVAECGAALLCMNLGIEKQPTPDHAKYLNSWLKVIGSDYKAIFTAMSQAQKAIDHLDSLQEAQAIAAE